MKKTLSSPKTNEKKARKQTKTNYALPVEMMTAMMRP